MKTAFLHGQLAEEIYMQQPVGYHDGTEFVCKLNKSLYGLKQASRCWNTELTRVLTVFGFKESRVDPCIFMSIKNNKRIILGLYVDDGLLASNDEKEMCIFLKELKKFLEIRISDLNMFLDIKIDFI